MRSLLRLVSPRKIVEYTELKGDSSSNFDEERLLKSPASPTGSSEGSLDGDKPQDSQIYAPRSSRMTSVTIVNAMFFLLSLYLFTASFLGGNHRTESQERNYLLKQTSEPSPIFDFIDIPLKTWRLNGTFIEQDPPSIYRMPPSPEVDAAWERIETQTPIPISRQDIINQGKDPDDSVMWPESFGFGPDAYIGRIDVFHQIHCLNRLRKHLHFNFDYYFAGKRMNKYHELHVGHCLHTLLQNLMCTGNVDVYPHFWADAQDNAVPDFSINHKCRDFEAILEWHDAHAVPMDEFGALTIPEGVQPRIMNHAFKEAFEWYDEEHTDDSGRGTAVGK